MNKRPKKPTIDDVAARADVARVTVSRVINGGPNVRPEVRERVRAAIKELGYQVNSQARNLAAGLPRQIVLLSEWNLDAEPNSYYHAGLELGALTACTAFGYDLSAQFVGSVAPDWRRRILALIENRQSDGCILPPPFADDLELIEAIAAGGKAVTCISAGPEMRRRASSVGIDDREAGYDIARHILELGHRRIAYVQGIAEHLSAEQRYDGFCRAVAECGLNPQQFPTIRGNFTFRSGIECADAILSLRPDVTAIICGNDDMAAGALFACHRRGLNIPGQISIAGFDDSPVSRVIWPPLTTVSQPVKDIGHRAVLMLRDEIEGRRHGAAPQYEVVEHKVIPRQSTASPTRD